jgi:tRNA threonylcarbamoyladenosine biosynthesis protein TsaB
MAYILNIHTATETAIINLAEDDKVLGTLTNTETKLHAFFLHTAIRDLLKQQGISTKDLNAIGVTAGPGSYTGIRVGLASAKGLCYALNTPLITHSVLEVMAISAADFSGDAMALYCPMIDARRMEVYSALYDYNMTEIRPASAIILTADLFTEMQPNPKIFFSGSGSHKFQQISKYPNAIFLKHDITTGSLAKISLKKFLANAFINVTYAQPLYIK